MDAQGEHNEHQGMMGQGSMSMSTHNSGPVRKMPRLLDPQGRIYVPPVKTEPMDNGYVIVFAFLN